jgi:lysophospholipase L1-like esterase
VRFTIDRAAIAALPVETASADAASPANPSSPAATVISGISANTVAIFRRGQAMGNRRDVFSKVGDSITVAPDMYDPIGRGAYVLGDYPYLQEVVNFYLQTFARDQNSFANTSLAAGSGWTTATVLDPNAANTAVCAPGERPLDCEYRLTKPAVALIMLGSNDVHYFDGGTYQYNLEVITQTTLDQGIIPVLSTIPTRIGYEEKVIQFNDIIRTTAGAYGVPLWDYASVMATLPYSGLSGDGLHPSTSPSGYAGAANFTGENLAYGYVQRNLTMLQALDALYRRVLTQ